MTFAVTSIRRKKTSPTALSAILYTLAEKSKTAMPIEWTQLLDQAAGAVHTHESLIKIYQSTSFPGRPNESDDTTWVYAGYNKALGRLVRALDNPPLHASAAHLHFSQRLAWFLHEILGLVRTGTFVCVEASSLKAALLLTDMDALL